MSLISNLISTALGGSTNNANPQETQLLAAAKNLILQHGGIEGLQQKFQQNDLGHIFASWMGNGQNQPVTAQQITQVLGQDNVQQVANQTGVSHSDAAGGLAQLLPLIIDKLTPNGSAPAANNLQQSLTSLLSGGLGRLLK